MKTIIKILSFCLILFAFSLYTILRNNKSKHLVLLDESQEKVVVTDTERSNAQKLIEKQLLSFYVKRIREIVSQNILNDKVNYKDFILLIRNDEDFYPPDDTLSHNDDDSRVDFKILLYDRRKSRFEELNVLPSKDSSNPKDRFAVLSNDDKDNFQDLMPSFNIQNRTKNHLKFLPNNERGKMFEDLTEFLKNAKTNQTYSMSLVDNNNNAILQYMTNLLTENKNFPKNLPNKETRNLIKNFLLTFLPKNLEQLHNKNIQPINLRPLEPSSDRNQHLDMTREELQDSKREEKDSEYKEKYNSEPEESVKYEARHNSKYTENQDLEYEKNLNYNHEERKDSKYEKNLNSNHEERKDSNYENKQVITEEHVQNLTQSLIKPTDFPSISLHKIGFSNFDNCVTKNLSFRSAQNDHFMVLENYITADLKFKCNESITYVTYEKPESLENIATLTSRWKGPVSVAVYAPGDDFEEALQQIQCLRNSVPEVKQFVTFHMFFDMGHFPDTIPVREKLSPIASHTNCNKKRSSSSIDQPPYRRRNGLTYPVNAAKNIARSNSATYFKLVVDPQLYPSANIIPEFMQMVQNSEDLTAKRRVFVLPLFGLQRQSLPATKMELLSVLEEKKTSSDTDDFRCRNCYFTPNIEEWKSAKIQPGMHVFSTEKASDTNGDWNPYFIDTEENLVIEEQLIRSRKLDRFLQAYVMCLLDYEYHILDNAFLVHESDMRLTSEDVDYALDEIRRGGGIFYKYLDKYQKLYGSRNECKIPVY